MLEITIEHISVVWHDQHSSEAYWQNYFILTFLFSIKLIQNLKLSIVRALNLLLINQNLENFRFLILICRSNVSSQFNQGGLMESIVVQKIQNWPSICGVKASWKKPAENCRIDVFPSRNHVSVTYQPDRLQCAEVRVNIDSVNNDGILKVSFKYVSVEDRSCYTGPLCKSQFLSEEDLCGGGRNHESHGNLPNVLLGTISFSGYGSVYACSNKKSVYACSNKGSVYPRSNNGSVYTCLEHNANVLDVSCRPGRKEVTPWFQGIPQGRGLSHSTTFIKNLRSALSSALRVLSIEHFWRSKGK